MRSECIDVDPLNVQIQRFFSFNFDVNFLNGIFLCLDKAEISVLDTFEDAEYEYEEKFR